MLDALIGIGLDIGNASEVEAWLRGDVMRQLPRLPVVGRRRPGGRSLAVDPKKWM
ncbi:hypothetical protein [Phenylobacterium sp.]|uniref:hypothetical protein n=1 Tax=Phenylobacterium sp. TaxID=1871053 RepID=UPI002EDA96E3